MSDLAELLSSFDKGDAVAKVKAAFSLAGAVEAIAAIFFPAVAVAEIPTGALGALAVLAAELSEGKFTINSMFLGSLKNNAGEQQNEIISDRFDR
jgi:hypothetical protein